MEDTKARGKSGKKMKDVGGGGKLPALGRSAPVTRAIRPTIRALRRIAPMHSHHDGLGVKQWHVHKFLPRMLSIQSNIWILFHIKSWFLRQKKRKSTA